MSVKDELIFDFAMNIPRIMICGDMAILDNVRRIVMFSDVQIIVHNGNCYTCASGKKLAIKELNEERMIIKGELEQIEFFETL